MWSRCPLTSREPGPGSSEGSKVVASITGKSMCSRPQDPAHTSLCFTTSRAEGSDLYYQALKKCCPSAHMAGGGGSWAGIRGAPMPPAPIPLPSSQFVQVLALQNRTSFYRKEPVSSFFIFSLPFLPLLSTSPLKKIIIAFIALGKNGHLLNIC